MKNHYGHFHVTRSREISEINAQLIELVHDKTNSEVIFLSCDDDENIFNISLRTFPSNSHGTAHVLEHIVLCGSEKFPVKDPFFAMSRRSMNTFMNALTGTDFTCYPAASQIPCDFYNLFEVYLDAVFHPRLLEESFWQEGIHLELEKKSSLKLKGIVYNEMKGAMAQPESRLHEVLFATLFPDLPYRFNSGGNPNMIRQLTYQEVKDFHKQYYHPSRALFYFYGNLPLEKHLEFLEEHALQGVEKSPPLAQLPKQTRFKEKVYRTSYYPLAEQDEKKDKTFVALSFLTSSILEQEELLAICVIDLALMGTDAAPLKNALLGSNLCKQADSSLDDEISEVPMTITCKGCHENSADAIEKVVRDTLTTLAIEGIPKHLIEGALHQLEFAREEIAGSSYPYGLSLFFRSGLLKQHGGDPADGLKVHTLFKTLRDNFEKPHYVSQLLRKYFLDNTHFVRITLHPDASLTSVEGQEEEEYLKRIQASLSEEKRHVILKESQSLLSYQEEEGDLEILPRLSLSDVPKEGKDFPLKKEPRGDLSLFHHNCFTNEILYASLFFHFPPLAENELVFLRLFTLLTPELGCGGRDYRTHLDFVFQHTGGIDFDLDLFVAAHDPNSMQPTLSFQGKALRRNVDKLFSLFLDMLTSVDFSDVRRIEELLKQHLEGIENSIQKSPLRFALNLATSSFSPPLHLNYLWHGLDYCSKVKEVIKDFFNNPIPFQKKMEELKELILGPKIEDLVISANYAMYNDLKKGDFFGLPSAAMKKSPSSAQPKVTALSAVASQGRIISNPVAFTVLAFPAIPYAHPLTAALSVASEIMDNKTLHKRIREQGGAYGAGSTHMASWGYFYFHSYRDPHLKSTLDAFRESVEELSSGHFDNRDLEEAKLGVLQSLDSPVPPESRALVAYTWEKCGRTKELRHAHRERLLSLTKNDVKKAVEEILLPGTLSKGVVVTFGGKELLVRENELLKEKALPLFNV